MNRTKFIICLSFISFLSYSQSIEVDKDVKYDNLLQERKKLMSEIYVNDRIRIQIFTGDLDLCKKEIENIKKNIKKKEKYEEKKLWCLF